MKRLFLIPLVIVLVCGLIFGGCAKPAPPPAPAPPLPPIKIGVMYPITGPLAMTGEMMVTAAKFGFDEAGYEAAGRKVEVIIEDSGAVPEMAIDKARKLVEHDKVCMLIGPLIGGTKMAVSAYMHKAGVPHILANPAPWGVVEHEWTLAMGGSEPSFGYIMGLYAYDEMGLRTVTGMSEDTVCGRGFLGAFLDAFKKRGGQVIQEQYSPFPCTDYAPYLAALKDADAVVAWHHGADTIRFLTQLHEFGIRERMPLVAAFHGSFFSPFMLRELAPEVAEAVIGERCPTPYTSLLETDASKRFVEAFKKKYGYTPSESESGVYSGVQTALRALKATGGDTTPEKLRQAILALKFEGPEGAIRFDPETRFAIKNIYIVEVDKIGEEWVWVPVYTYEDVRADVFKHK